VPGPSEHKWPHLEDDSSHIVRFGDQFSLRVLQLEGQHLDTATRQTPDAMEAPTAADTSYSRGRHFLALFLISIFGIIAYLPSFRVPFLYDDLWEILGNRSLMDLSDLDTILRYNPARALLMLTFAVDLHFWGQNTFPYHLENLAIHLTNGLLVYAIGERLLGRLGERSEGKGGLEAPSGWTPALAVALIFIVHPLFVEAVTYIASRSSSLATLFYLAAFLAYVRFRDAQFFQRSSLVSSGWLFVAVNAYILSIATKEEGVSLPAIALAYDLLLAPRRDRPGLEAGIVTGDLGSASWKTHDPTKESVSWAWWLGTAPLWIMLGVLIWARLKLYDTMMPPVLVRSSLLSTLTGLEVFFVYLRQLVLPYGLSIYHDYLAVVVPFNLKTGLAILGHLVLLGVMFRSWRRWPLLSFALIWFYAALSPTTSFIPLKEPMAEHRMYLASFGLLWCFGAGLYHLRARRGIPPLAVGTLIALVLGVVTFQYNQVWQEEVALWKRATELAPHSGDAEYALAAAYTRIPDWDLAEGAYLRAIRKFEDRGMHKATIQYSYVDSLNNLGLVYVRRGRLDMGISYFRRALMANTRYTQGWNNLGFAQLQKGNTFEAELSFEEALHTDSESWLAHYHLGDLYYGALDRPSKAAFHYKRALQINPHIPDADRIKRRILELGF